ncbi:response regulator transcription factor [Nonomuraea sp. NPDC049784]|uniref:response regulator transcription factor n=1 Tax=Nonomuraea sp. NPDC049784 TaxID=3154361 RepID=UPI0033C8E01B
MTDIRPISVVVADDHPIFRSGLRQLVEDSPLLEFAGEAADGEQAVELCRERQPDVVLMDIHMPGTNGISATRRILADLPSTGILVLTMLEDDTSIFAALRAGARGYVVKGSGPDDIIRAITAVAAGQALLDVTAATRIASFLQPDARNPDHPFPSLSTRERDILDLMAAGRSNAAIAEALALSEKTVRNNVSNIFTKLQVTSRSDAIVKARRAGLGEPATLSRNRPEGHPGHRQADSSQSSKHA